jgi:peptidoglycan/LPS O-acetylase OafA/YrhL
MALLGLWLAASCLTTLWNIRFPVDFLLSPLHLLFGAGMLGAIAIVKGWGRPRLTAAVGAIFFALSWLSQVLGIQPLAAMPVWLYGAGALLLIVGFAQMELRHGLTTPKFLQQMGDASYSLYLVHFPIISLCTKLFFWLNGRFGGLPLILYFLMTVGIAIAGGFAFHRCIEAPLLKLGKQAFARRASHPVKAMD